MALKSFSPRHSTDPQGQVKSVNFTHGTLSYVEQTENLVVGKGSFTVKLTAKFRPNQTIVRFVDRC